MSTGVVLLDYNQADVTVRCLDSIVECDTHPDTIVLVENGETEIPERDTERFRQRLELVVLRPGENLGCAGGRNLGLNYLSLNTDVSTYVILDNDTVVPDGFFAGVERLNPDPLEVHAPVVEGMNDNSVWSGGWLEGNGTPKVHRSVPESDGGSVPVDWAPGACLIFGPETWEEVGEFDERMQFYFEDTDWCVRVRRAGGRIFVEPDIRVLHEKHHSLDGKEGSKRTRFWARNGTIFRAHSVEVAVPTLLTWGGKQLRLVLTDSLHGNPHRSVARLRGLAEGVVKLVSRR